MRSPSSRQAGIAPSASSTLEETIAVGGRSAVEHRAGGAVPVLPRPALAADVRGVRVETVALDGFAERGEPLVAARLARRPGEQPDSLVAVGDHVVDQDLDSLGVVEEHRPVARVGHGAVEEDARDAAAPDHVVEDVEIDADGREQQAVDPVAEQRPERLDLAVARLLAVHQHHAVARLLERDLRALERAGVERARDVGDDEADREGTSGSGASARGARAGS